MFTDGTNIGVNGICTYFTLCRFLLHMLHVQCMYVIFFKLRLGASIGHFVGRLVSPSTKIWTISVAPQELSKLGD